MGVLDTVTGLYDAAKTVFANKSIDLASNTLTGTTAQFNAAMSDGDFATAGSLAAFYSAGGTDVAVADGGTGASTASAARTNLGLAIGTDVAAQAIPGLWTPSDAYLSGNYYWCNSAQANSTANSLGQAVLRVSPWTVVHSVNVIRVFAEFTVAGDAASVFRIGIWNNTTSFRPGTLVVDAGSISTGTGNAGTVATGGTPGVYEMTINVTLAPGVYWVGGAVQGVTTTQPTMRTVSNYSAAPLVAIGTSLPAAAVSSGGYAQTSITGTLADFTASPVNSSSAPIRVGFKVA